ncbi:MAG: aquaporin [Phycisphaerae bacterium]|jgi:aquaporin Z
MNVRAYVAEFISTFALVFIGVAAIANNAGGLVGVALAHGLALCVMITATAAVSGGHVNPAVTIGLLVTGKIDLPNAIGYIVSQCLGAVAASLVLLAAIPGGAAMLAGGTPALAKDVSTAGGIIMEAVMTFFLVFAVYGTAVDARAPRLGGLLIGLTVTLDILAGGPYTGAAMNPARHLGPALLSGSSAHMAAIWLYWVGPALGGAVAGLVYHHVLWAPQPTRKAA